MPSKRDLLLKANKKNSETRGNTASPDTVFGDFANRTVEEPINFTAYEDDIVPNNLSNNLDNNKAYISTSKIEDTNEEPIQSTQAFTVEENKIKGIEVNKIEQIPVKKNTKDINYSISSTNHEYVIRTSAHLGMTITEFIINVIKDEIYNGKYEDNELANMCRKRQQRTVYRALKCDEAFNNLVKEKAKEYYMRPSNFICYCIEKSKIKYIKN